MRAKAGWVGGSLLVVFAAIQAVPVERGNPPVESDVAAPADVAGVLRRACYDCHSNETKWPWYSRIAPASWLVARDVREGRRELNLSRWGLLDREKQRKLKREAWEQVAEREMPPWFYTPLHSEARLAPADKALLKAWFEGTSDR